MTEVTTNIPRDNEIVINESFLLQLPEMWLEFARNEHGAKLLAACGQNPRQRARGFIHNSLVDGYVMSPTIGPAMAGAITWLLSTIEDPQCSCVTIISLAMARSADRTCSISVL